VKKTLIGIAAIAALMGTPALGADMALKAPPPPEPVWNWTGFYVGGNLGGKWADTSGSVFMGGATGFGITTPAGTLPLAAATAGTFMGGGQFGYNWQVGAVVFGLEADVDGHNWSTTRTAAGTGLPAVFIPGDSFSVDSQWQASLRARLGYAFDHTLLYVTGGPAWTGVNVNTNFIATTAGGFLFPASSASDSRTLTGGTVGGGIEYAIVKNWTIGLEGRYTWYGSATYNGGSVAAIAGSPTGPYVLAPATQTLSLSTAEVLGKINFKF